MTEMLKISREAKEQIIYDIENGELLQPCYRNEKWYTDEDRGYDILVSIDLTDEYRAKEFTIVVEDNGKKYELDQEQANEIYRAFDEAASEAYESDLSEAGFRDYLWSCCLHM